MSMLSKTTAIIMAIIAVTILLSAGAGLITPFNNAGLANSQLCVDASPACFWNASRSVDCTASNMTAGDTTACTSVGSSQPFGSFFESTGLMPLILGAVLIVGAITMMILLIRKKRG